MTNAKDDADDDNADCGVQTSPCPNALKMNVISIEEDGDDDVVPETPVEVIIDDSENDDDDKGIAEKWDSLGILKWTEEGICIICNKGDSVLVCTNEDCPVSAHASCLPFSPFFDKEGKFYCPLCSYKQWVDEQRRKNKNVQLTKKKYHKAKKSLSVFVNGPSGKKPDEKPNQRETRKRKASLFDQEGNRDKSHGSMSIQREQGIVDGNENGGDRQEAVVVARCSIGNLGAKRSSVTEIDITSFVPGMYNTESALLSDTFGCRGKGKVIKDVDEHQHVPEDEDEHVQPANNADSQTCKLPCSDTISGDFQTQENRNEAEMDEGNQSNRVGENNTPLKANVGVKSNIATVDAEWRKKNKGVAKNNVDPQKASSSIVCADAEEITLHRTEKKRSKSETRNKSTKTNSNPALPDSRRKRLYFTPEEEKMLREAVPKFSDSNPGKPIPWLKILEFGSQVFNESRYPMDLRDKWRHMTKGCRAKRR
ncbi:hypothetical protein GIB67_008507 [Kingdonia uniflora]|uniref:Zinc finger PHD-type domain-containing protein n=1 Tax=Kingdonia uniflora TaxID=39325 RepID=A0A7J7LFL1_9MAGN|nr:hypothetical protein GIB67_008507 [Kingdonia uniflora]